MASKKSTKATTKKSAPKSKSTAVRNTPIPRGEVAAMPAAAKAEVTHDMIARRAYEIWTTTGGCEFSNWTAAESELRAA